MVDYINVVMQCERTRSIPNISTDELLDWDVLCVFQGKYDQYK